MIWLSLLLLGIAVGDLVAAATGGRLRRVVAGVATVVVFAALADAGRSFGDVLGVIVVAVAVALWLASHDALSRRQAWVPLGILASSVVASILLSPSAPTAGGAVGHWVADAAWPAIATHDADRALLVLGAFLVQLSTGNVIVRLVLLATGTLKSTTSTDDATTTLRGGRLLGPMERVLILGLGLAHDYTAAGVVIAAKGLLRFPELQAVRGDAESPGIDEVTEYFLVGSFLSWLLAFATLALAHG